MTDKDIIKALECCTEGIFVCDKDCPCFDIKADLRTSYCKFELLGEALDLINRQQAEIKRLKVEKASLIATYKESQIEAIKKFAEKLKNRLFNYYDFLNENTSKNYDGCETLMAYEIADMIRDCIESVLDEMVGADNEKQ